VGRFGKFWAIDVQAPNPKHQKTNKFEIQMKRNDRNFGVWMVKIPFPVCDI
jgi:hypothetical protein